MRSLRSATGLLVVLLVTAGCLGCSSSPSVDAGAGPGTTPGTPPGSAPVGTAPAGGGETQEPGGTAAPGNLPDAQTYVSTSVTQAGAPRPLLGGTTVRLAFADGRITANAGCNTMSGPYTVAGSTLKVGPDLSSTMMGCPDGGAEQDTWLSTFLTSDPTFVLDGTTLTLTSGATVMVLADRTVAEPDRSLTGTHWDVDTVIAGASSGSGSASGTASSTVGANAWIELAADGTAQFFTGCNSGTASYTTSGDQITFSKVTAPALATPCAPDAAAYEGPMLATVKDGVTSKYTIKGPVLTLMHGQDGIGLRATT